VLAVVRRLPHEQFAGKEDSNMIRRHGLIWQSGLFLVLTSSLTGCSPNAPPVAEAPPPPATVSQPVVRTVTDYDEYEGRIAAIPKVELRARVRGHLTKVNFEAGQRVKAGDLLYEIDDRTYQAALGAAQAKEKAAEAALEFAKAEYNRTRYLASKGAASREEMESWAAKESVAKGDVLKEQAAVKEAQLDVDFCRVTAPISGKISRTLVDVGNLVNGRGGETLLTTLVSVEPMYVYLNVDERSLLRYRRNALKGGEAAGNQPSFKELKIPFSLALEGETDCPHKGVLDFADNRVNPSTGTIQVRGVMPGAGRLFDDGMRARVRVPVGSPHEVVMVTERALGNDQGRKFVYVVNGQDTVERRDVIPDRVVDGLQVIREGLKPDEWVIVNGIQRVRDGMKVEPKRGPMLGAPRPAEAAHTKLP
jgi:RND family efflux transporter MFP subunit